LAGANKGESSGGQTPSGTGKATRALRPAAVSMIFQDEGYKPSVYHPTSGSGVTLGYGYDMGSRKKDAVVADLAAVGVDRTLAEQIAGGAGLRGKSASKFVLDNAGAEVLTKAQAAELLSRISTDYDDAIRKAVKVPLTQNQYEAPFSLVYNIGEPNFKQSTVLRYLNAGDYKGASDAFMKLVHSNGKFMPGLRNRRLREVAHFNGQQK